jgi:hypothetical protein
MFVLSSNVYTVQSNRLNKIIDVITNVDGLLDRLQPTSIVEFLLQQKESNQTKFEEVSQKVRHSHAGEKEDPVSLLNHISNGSLHVGNMVPINSSDFLHYWLLRRFRS